MGRGALSWNADRWKAALDSGSDPPGYSSGPDHLGSVVHRDGTGATIGEVVFASLRLDKTPDSRQVWVRSKPGSPIGSRALIASKC